METTTGWVSRVPRAGWVSGVAVATVFLGLVSCTARGPSGGGGSTPSSSPSGPGPEGGAGGSGAGSVAGVHEPTIPGACTTVTARLTTTNGHLAGSAESQPDTVRLQQAIDSCPAGQAVRLVGSGSALGFLSGPLTLKSGVTLWLDKGTTLFATRNPRDYDVTPGACGVLADKNGGCHALITAAGTTGSGVVGEGTIDGRGGEALIGQSGSWWDLAAKAKTEGNSQNNPRLVQINDSHDFTLYRVTLRNGPNFHVVPYKTDGFVAWGVRIDTPATARNTDGIDPSSSTHVSIVHSWISTGDDDVAIKAGSAGPTSHVLIADDHFYAGHGMSIGSETNGGVDDVVVRDLSIDGADNGLRIKSDASRGGMVTGVVYDGVCMRNVKNPLVFDPFYSSASGSKIPDFREVALHDVHSLSGGKLTIEGHDAQHRLGLALDNVVLDGQRDANVKAAHAVVTVGPGPVSLKPSGDDVTVRGTTSSAPARDCSRAFPALPRG